MPFARFDGIEIYYERGGDGPPLLFISGSGGDLRNKPNHFDSPLAQHYELIGYDQRGLGQSGNPPGNFTMQDYADDAARLLDHLEIDRIPVVGVSFGGMVAQEFALRHAARVSRLVLACTSAGGDGGASYPLHELAVLSPAERAERNLRLSDTRRSDAWIAANPDKWSSLMELATAGRHAGTPEGAMKQFDARRGHDTFARLPELDMPVLLVGGEHDGIAPPANMRAMQRQIAGSELRFFDGGHLFLVQDRNAYPFIIQWLMESS
jgi:3-oxoadipate enol-lactonase